MGITVSVLEGMTPSALDYTQANLDAAGKWFGDADDSFTAQAVTPVETGAAWSGDGQPDAVTVLGINGTAVQIGVLAMEAAGNAVSGLRLAMERARNVVVGELETKPPYMTIHDNGYVVVEREKFDAHTDGMIPDADAEARVRTRRVIGALLYATAADTCYASLFSGIGDHLPTYTDSADPGALAHNRRQLQNVVSDVNVSNDLLRFWEDQRPPTLSEQDLNYLTNGPPPGLAETLLTILDVGTTLFSFIPLARGANMAIKGIRFLSRFWRAGEEAPSPPKGPEPELDQKEIDRRHALGWDPATRRYRPEEELAAVEIERRHGITLERYQPQPGERNSPDWIDPKTGKTYDAVGSRLREQYFDDQWDAGRVQYQVVRHLDEKADYVPVDVRNLSPAQRAQVEEYVQQLNSNPQYRDRVFIIGDGN